MVDIWNMDNASNVRIAFNGWCISRKFKSGHPQHLSRRTQPVVKTGDFSTQTTSDCQMQCVPCTQDGRRFDKYRCGTKICRINFYRDKVHGCKPLKIGNGLLASVSINGTRPLFDATDAGHLG